MLVSPGLSFSSIMDEFLSRGREGTENNRILYVIILFKVYVDMKCRVMGMLMGDSLVL
jgi:hypothetical protein